MDAALSSAMSASVRHVGGKDPLVSIVIPTFNSVRHLGRCLESVAAQTYGSLETIVVDNYSLDGTDAVAAFYPVRFTRFQGNAAAARNLGIKESQGRFILLLDADQVLQSDFVRVCIDALSSGVADGLIVPERSVGRGFWVKVLGFEKDLVESDVSAAIPRFFRAEVLAELGEDESLVFGEDWDLYRRFKQRGWLASAVDVQILHYESGSLSGILIKCLHYGFSFRRLVEKQGSATYRRYTLLPVSLRRFVKHLRNDPFHGAGFLLLRFLRVFFFMIGFFAGFFTRNGRGGL